MDRLAIARMRKLPRNPSPLRIDLVTGFGCDAREIPAVFGRGRTR
jgi:hypothetical protein